ncbi:hypothetical protein WAI453_002034 [Rhynchosporium graminicola]
MECFASISADFSTITITGLGWAVVRDSSSSYRGKEPRYSLREGTLIAASSETFPSILDHIELDYQVFIGSQCFQSFQRTLLVDFNGSVNIDWMAYSTTSFRNVLLQAGISTNDQDLLNLILALDELSNDSQAVAARSHLTLLAGLEEELSCQRIFTTEEGYIGKFFRENVQAGDIVCVMLGGPAPIPLRPEGTQFEFLGDIYVDGIMYGEAIEALERGDIELRDFELI